jgi:phosphatidylglycerol:prolipoprotein diacylglycerol transferase
MMPYIEQPSLHVGPFTVHAFGVLVACAVLVGVEIVRHRAKAAGLPEEGVATFVTWILAGGFVGAHLVDRLIYFPRETLADPLSLLWIWSGLSSFGGFIGGTCAALVFFRTRAGPKTAWRYVDSFAYAFPFGWVLGRAGCFLAYDHPGRSTRFVLGEVYRDGVVRHNLGLEEAIYTAAIAGVFFVLGRQRRFDGLFLGLVLLLYAPFRFSMDFLRIVDVRYFGLTPGQYGCVALLFVAAAILVTRRGHPGGQTLAHTS